MRARHNCPTCGRGDIYLDDPWERFMANVRIVESGCWEWGAGRQSAGYGRFNVSRTEPILAHRYSYIRNHGEIPAGLLVRHKCDNRPCVNPDHLEIGTHADNVRDMVERGRQNKIGTPRKLTAEKVREIRARLATESQLDLAREYGVSASAMSQIARKRIWKHVA